MYIDGYRSTSLDEKVAMNFAALAETDDLDQVVLNIKIENKFQKYYICLDRDDYSLYCDEKEVLLQAGLIARVNNVEMSEDGQITIFNLEILDPMVEKLRLERLLEFLIPTMIYGVQQIYKTVVNFIYMYHDGMRMSYERSVYDG